MTVLLEELGQGDGVGHDLAEVFSVLLDARWCWAADRVGTRPGWDCRADTGGRHGQRKRQPAASFSRFGVFTSG